MMERLATQSVSEHGDPGRDGHRWSVAGTGVGPETAREIKPKTVTSVCIHAAHLRPTDPV